jgi:hypothetical protein
MSNTATCFVNLSFSALPFNALWSTPERIEELRGEGEAEYLCHPTAMHPTTRTATEKERKREREKEIED